MTVSQATSLLLNHRYREQARSHRSLWMSLPLMNIHKVLL